MSGVTVNQGTVGVDFTGTLTADDVVVDLTAAVAVHFLLRNSAGAIILDQIGTVTDAPNGDVEYVSVLGDLDVAGNLRQNWLVDWGATTEEHPSVGWNTVDVISTAPPSPDSAPCDQWTTWDFVESACSPPVLPGDETTQELIQQMILAAVSRELWTKTCEQYGVCSATVRPLPCCQHRRGRCSCGTYRYLELSDEPVASVEEVLIDGAVLDPSAYRVDEFARLVRIDGQSWPTCNDLGADSGDAGTFEVTFSFGVPIPAEGALAAALLACKWADGIATGDCEVPANTTSVNREGVTIELHPPTLSTGNVLVDEWLNGFQCGHEGIFDPGGVRRFARVGP